MCLKTRYSKSAFFDHEDILVLTLECPSQVCYAFILWDYFNWDLKLSSLGYILMAEQNNLGFKLRFGEAIAKIIKNWLQVSVESFSFISFLYLKFQLR